MNDTVLPAGSGKSITWSIKEGDDYNTANAEIVVIDETVTEIWLWQIGEVVMVATIDNNPALTKEFSISYCNPSVPVRIPPESAL